MQKQSLLTTLLASRGDAQAARARLSAAKARADELEPWLRAFTSRADNYDVDAAVNGPLAGLPVGIKDLIDTRDMPTAYGSPVYRGHQPSADARIVESIRQAGGVVFGKTVTTEFAWREPGPTVNPWNRLHTPGGSSSGSAAAVAAGIVPLALGTQTVGSVIRPAAYCGVVGYKPSFGKVSRDGVHPLSGSLDHVGFFAQTVEGVALAHALFVEHRSEVLASLEAWTAWFPANAPARLGVLRTPFWDRVQPAQKENFDASLERLRAAGAVLVELEYGADMQAMVDAVQVIACVEAHRAIGPIAAGHGELVSEHMHRLIAAGAATPAAEYEAAIALQARLRRESKTLLAGCEALVTLSAPGEAPAGLSDTGDGIFCAPWSLTGSPAVTVPSGRTANGLPLAFQVVGEFGADLSTLQIAAWVESQLQAQWPAASVSAGYPEVASA
ncbi:amidase (plasmid) [Paraburkholderia sp. FT54]|uniref:amidase n=1 Tax=Paraburkholderia sp. FT54 TaxID=3074437 RepID=UPI002877A159|nr:amidase [Paraburkholderia sp. FT54]WNC95429.1 amidase [Paraburkholderia sp. FT54]